MPLVLFNPQIESYQVLPRRAIVDLGAMAIETYSAFPKVKLAIVVEGDRKALFSIATTPRCRGGRYSFPWITPWLMPSERLFVWKWTWYRDWSSNSLTTMSQSSTLATTPWGLLCFSFSFCSHSYRSIGASIYIYIYI